MYSSYQQIESALCQLTAQIQSNFSAPWLLHPASPALPVLACTPPPHIITHSSRLFEFCCVLDGSVLLQVEQQVLQLQQGQLFLLPAGIVHAEVPHREYSGTIAWFVFFADRVWVNVCALDDQAQMHILHGQPIPIDPIAVSLLLKDITKELSSSQFGAPTLAKCAALQTLLLLIRQLKSTEHKLSAEQWRQSIAKEVIAYLRSYPGKTPDIALLADNCAMSVNHLTSIFKAVTGKTINAYCNDMRIEQAKQLLENTPIKLRELSEQLGYYDQYHFCKAFKKATGKSPSAYRAEKNGKEFT